MRKLPIGESTPPQQNEKREAVRSKPFKDLVLTDLKFNLELRIPKNRDAQEILTSDVDRLCEEILNLVPGAENLRLNETQSSYLLEILLGCVKFNNFPKANQEYKIDKILGVARYINELAILDKLSNKEQRE